MRPPQDTRAKEGGAAEVAPFRLIGYEGHVLVRYLLDDNSSQQTAGGQEAGAKSRQKLTDLREEVFLMTHSYVYHPNFLLADLGGGPILDTSGFATDDSNTRSTKPMYNLVGRATVLRDKPYRGTVFYEHLNPTQSVGPAQVLLTESDRYGLNASLLEPVTPVPLFLEASRSHSKGSGADQTLDDRIDQVLFRADRRIGTLGNTRFGYTGIRQDSLSGSAGLPIQASHNRSNVADLDSRLSFGAKREYELSNVANFSSQEYSTDQGTIADTRDLRFTLDLRGQHSPDLMSYARYNFTDSRVDAQSTRLHSASAGATCQASPDLSGTLAVQGDYNKTTQLTSTTAGINGSVTYRHAVPLGQASASYNFAYAGRDQQAFAEQALIVGERLTLPGTTLVPLRTPNVVPGTVVVMNVPRTQTFIEGIDYVLSVLGVTTRIQRVIGGNIVDGQEVLADYAFEVGGTYAMRQFDNSLNLNWEIRQYLSLYVRYFDSAPSLVSGQPTFEINPVRNTLWGARADVPLSMFSEDLTVGGFVEREDRREVISPGLRQAWEAYVQSDLPFIGRGGIRVGARQTRVDYDNSPEQGVNLRAYDLRIWSRLGYGFDVSIDATRERDTGTPVLRERNFLSAKLQWRIRQFRLTFDLTRTRDAQGPTERTRNYAQLVLRRDF